MHRQFCFGPFGTGRCIGEQMFCRIFLKTLGPLCKLHLLPSLMKFRIPGAQKIANTRFCICLAASGFWWWGRSLYGWRVWQQRKRGVVLHRIGGIGPFEGKVPLRCTAWPKCESCGSHLRTRKVSVSKKVLEPWNILEPGLWSAWRTIECLCPSIPSLYLRSPIFQPRNCTCTQRSGNAGPCLTFENM